MDRLRSFFGYFKKGSNTVNEEKDSGKVDDPMVIDDPVHDVSDGIKNMQTSQSDIRDKENMEKMMEAYAKGPEEPQEHEVPKDKILPIKLAKNMKQTNAGGFSFEIDDMARLKRFIVLGSESGTYYAKPTELTEDNIKCVKCLIEQGKAEEMLDILEEYSVTGRVAKDDSILLALMNCALCTDEKVQQAAYGKVSKICNIPTKLFHFLELTQQAINKKRQSEKKEDRLPQLQLKNRKRKLGEEKIPSESSDYVKPAKKRKKKDKVWSEYKTYNTKPRKSSGWGRMRRRAIASFYTDPKKDANRLLYLLTKYKQRHTWSHKQVLGYAHPKIADDQQIAKNLVLTYCIRGSDRLEKEVEKVLQCGSMVDSHTNNVIQNIRVLESIRKLSPSVEGDEEKLLGLLNVHGIRSAPDEFTTASAFGTVTTEPPKNVNEKRVPFQIVREHIPNGFLKSSKVWEALLQDMPMTALYRNLGKMTSLGLFDQGKEANVKIVVDAFSNVKRLKASRIHPIKLLVAMKIYKQGTAAAEEQRFFFFRQPSVTKDKRPPSTLTWNPNNEILDVLDKAFYLSFKQPELQGGFKTGKKFMLALDVSGSMTFQGCFGCEQITPAIASTALAMVTWNIEDNVQMVAFGGHLVPLETILNKDMTIVEAMSAMSRINFGSTDCSLPMTYALEKKLDIDVFIVYTDSDTGYGRVHPIQALKKYRKEINSEAKLIVAAMSSNGFSIADPNDAGMLDIVGFDTNVPDIIKDFANNAFVKVLQ